MKNKIIKNISWALTGRILAALLQTTSIILLARWETLENFGIVISVLTFSILLHAFIDFGLSTYLIKERAKNKDSDKVYACIKINSLIANNFALAAGVILILLGVFQNPLYFSLLPLALWLAYEKRADQLIGIFIADGNNKTSTQLLMLRRFLALTIFIVIFFLSNTDPTLAYTLGISIAATLSYFHTYSLVHADLPKNSPDTFRTIFKHTFPYWINSLFAQLRNIDVIVVTAISGTIHGAYFGFVNRAISPLNMLATSMASVILPSVSKKEIQTEALLKYLIITTLLASFPFLILYFLVDFIIPFLLGNQYLPTVELVKIICIGLIFFSASSILGSMLQGVDLQNKVAFVNIFSTSFYLIFLIPLAYMGNSLYAAYTLVGFFIIRFIAMFSFLIQYLYHHKRNYVH